MLVVRYSGDPRSIADDVRQTLTAVNRNIHIADVTTLEDQVIQSVVPQSIIARLSTFFSLLALTLACVGIYGLMSYAVSNQTREIGIRLALGARHSNIQWSVLSRVLLLLALGLMVGMPAAMAANRLLSSMLFELKPTDPLSIAMALLLLVTVAVLAGYLPARRAAKVDPMVALRYE